MEAVRAIFRRSPELHEVMAEMALARPPVKSAKLERKPADPKGDAYLNEYAELASAIGIMPPDLGIESFKAFLIAHDLPIYSLTEVVAYMDNIAARESKEAAGWEWRPLRQKDDEHLDLHFGRQARRGRDEYGNRTNAADIVAGSDYYSGPTERMYVDDRGNQKITRDRGTGRVYNRTIPLHAVRRVALIEREHKGPVAFFVSDYALAPAIQYPDPFLMVVVPNPKAHLGEGRFVIDFWDEPGFGIDKMLK